MQFLWRNQLICTHSLAVELGCQRSIKIYIYLVFNAESTAPYIFTRVREIKVENFRDNVHAKSYRKCSTKYLITMWIWKTCNNQSLVSERNLLLLTHSLCIFMVHLCSCERNCLVLRARDDWIFFLCPHFIGILLNYFNATRCNSSLLISLEKFYSIKYNVNFAIFPLYDLCAK